MNIAQRIVKACRSDPTTGITIQNSARLVRLGSKYGKWIIPENFLNQEAVCFLVGAGENISFDCEIAKRYESRVYIIDPTRRAKEHFNLLKKNVLKRNEKKASYEVNKGSLDRMEYLSYGIAGKTGLRKFYEPKNPEHVSYSIANLQNTKRYFKAKCYKISDLMKNLGHKKIDLLKLDVEGAEYEVIESIIKDNVTIDVICVEYDELNSPLDDRYKIRIKESVRALINSDYNLVSIDSLSNYTFIKSGLRTEEAGVLSVISNIFRQGKNLLLMMNNQIKERSLQ